MNVRQVSPPGLSFAIFLSTILLFLVASSTLVANDQRPALPILQPSASASATGKVLNLVAGDDLQKALDAAAPGDVISLPAGAMFEGPFTLSPKNTNNKTELSRWITIRTRAGPQRLPKAGVRVSPLNAPAMAKLTSSGGAILTTLPGASYYQFIGIEFTPTFSSEGVLLTELVRLEARDFFRAASKRADNVGHFIFARCYFHGDATLGTRRGIVLNGGATAIVDSYFSDFKIRGHDSQAIVGWGGTGPYLIRNNYLEAAGENIMFGGADPLVRNQVPSDISILGNHFAKPLAWRSAGNWTIKNILELKNARRVLIRGNLLEYNWPESQNGFAILFTVRNQEGTAPWSTVEDVTFIHNIVRRVGSGINILGYDNHHPSGQSSRILIANNLFYDVGGSWGAGHLLQVLDAASDVHFVRNTALGDGHMLVGEGRPSTGLVFSNNIVRHSGYGIVGQNKAPGRSALAHYFPDYRMSENTIIGGSRSLYPKQNHFLKNLSPARLEDIKRGNYHLIPAATQDIGADIPELCKHLSPTEAMPDCAQYR